MIFRIAIGLNNIKDLMIILIRLALSHDGLIIDINSQFRSHISESSEILDDKRLHQ